jgi:TetR/AcrR family transcriptional regulator, repressor for neighboring sulfatase
MTHQANPPRGKEAVKEALFNAAAYCFAEHGISNTSVREIATRAQVNHGLVHRHFGSKDELLKALLRRLADAVDQRLNQRFGNGPIPPPAELLPQIFADTTAVGLHWRVVLRALLEGVQPEELQTQFPVFKTLVSSYRSLGHSSDVALAEAALAFSTGLGFLTFQGYIQTAITNEGGDWETVRPILMQRFLSKLS